MLRAQPDRHDDVVNPLRPWRSAVLIFLAGWAVVLADILDLPMQGRGARREGFEPAILWLPFLCVAAYLALWMAWSARDGHWKRRSRALRDRLRDEGASPQD
ncbi:hypothetical protein B7G68_06150 [Caulobacter segnis]|uniref:Uncharacterized protein n=2 Tax=Caulobacter segnis TaxID=88688 RepID=D5VFG2_CAUST|nr:hypothetical protein [Caulobacter segnis]ADG09694.1 hypothetical protein Cseg_1193 [Caulobacter segnis ATCC 21756]AVQ01472.1 hypothetical protein B7G68_06150 [Caulobacter segnis]